MNFYAVYLLKSDIYLYKNVKIMIEEEIYKDVAGYEGLYKVSNLGNVRSVGMWTNIRGGSKRFLKGRVLKSGKGKGGYLIVVLCKDGKQKTHTVHRLVAQAFIDNPNNLPEVNHIDENKENNVVTNLEWCSYSYNINYGTRNERHAKALRGIYNNPKLSKKVLQLTLDGKIVREWDSVNECGRNGFSIGHVSACCNGKRKTHKGYRWMYAEDYYKLFAA